MTDERRYGEAELHAIFERAAERQDEARRAEAASRGQLTLAELQEIGSASGIDPAHVAAAARDVATDPPREVHTFLGAPTEIERTRLLPGPVSDESWAQMVAEVRRTFEEDGSIGQIGAMREWSAAVQTAGSKSDRPMRLELEPDEAGGMRATLRQSVRKTTQGFAIAGAINGAMALLFVVLAVFGPEPEVWVPAVMTAVMALGLVGGARGWLGYWGRQQQEKFDGVLDRLELIARSEISEPISQTATSVQLYAPEREGRVDLDALPDASSSAGATKRDRTRS